MQAQQAEPDVRPILIVGSGGFGREVLDVIEAMNEDVRMAGPTWDLIGFVSDTPPGADLPGAADRLWLGTVSHALGHAPRDAYFVVAIGDPKARRRIASQFENAGFRAARLLHPRASLGSNVERGPGSIICAHATLTTNISVGPHSIINIGATVGHDSELGSYSTVSPQSALSGNTRVGEGAFLGTGCIILPGCSVGDEAVVGAGALVTHDVSACSTVIGVPARVIGAPE